MSRHSWPSDMSQILRFLICFVVLVVYVTCSFLELGEGEVVDEERKGGNHRSF